MTEQTTKKRTTDEKWLDENVILIGKKPPMSNVIAVVTQFNDNGSKEVI